MSFSGMVKEELSRHIGSGRHCRIADWLQSLLSAAAWRLELMGENPCVSRQKMRHFQEKALHYCKKHLI